MRDSWSQADLDAHYARLKQPTASRPAVQDDGGTQVRVENGVISFVVPTIPRTKKTSSQVIFIPSKGHMCEKCGKAATKNHRRCPDCGGRLGFTKVIPSSAYLEWFAESMKFAPKIRAELVRLGVSLPIGDYVQLSAVFYRERDQGDLCGFLQAICDWLQSPRDNEFGKRVRDGAGIITDDVVVRSFDGSRLLKDGASPRTEVRITVIAIKPSNGDLFAEQEEKW